MRQTGNFIGKLYAVISWLPSISGFYALALYMDRSVKSFGFRGSSFRISCTENVPQDSSWFSFVDEAEVRDRDWDVRAGDLVLDVGSAYGSYTLTALCCGASHVHCWNPIALENDLLRESLALNGWSDRVTFHEYGLYSKAGWVNETSMAYSETEVKEFGWNRVESLDSSPIVLPEGRLWLKIDVEGAEAEVLAGSESLIRSRRPTILVENHQFKDPGIQERVHQFLLASGYSMIRCLPHHGVSHALYEPDQGAGG